MILQHIILKYFFLILSLLIAIRKNSAKNVRFGAIHICLVAEHKLLLSFTATVPAFEVTVGEIPTFSPRTSRRERSVFLYPRQIFE